MSIDSLIQDKKDAIALGGKPLNPGVGPDLIEVLASRKLLEEKAMAARDMALKQQTIPNTIAEQQEQKLLGLTQKEIANQTGGILANRAQQPQQRPPQPGGIMGAPRPPMGGAPRPPMGGAPRPPMGGAPRPPMGGAPRPPMGGAPRPRMASGGIVGYDVGGKVKSAQESIRALGNTTDKASPEYQAKLQRILDTLSAQAAPEEITAVKKVLEDAGLKTGAAKMPDPMAAPKDKLRAGEYRTSGNQQGNMMRARRDYINKLEELYRNNDIGKNYLDSERRAILDGKRDSEISSGTAVNTDDINRVAANLGINVSDDVKKKAMALANTNVTADKLDTSALATPNKLTGAPTGGAPKPPTGDMGGLGVLRPQDGASTAKRTDTPLFGKKPEARPAFSFQAPQSGAPQAPQAPQAGGIQNAVNIPKPEGFEVKRDAVSSGMGDAFNKKLDDRMGQNPADVAEKERTAAATRYKKDETLGGLQNLLDRDLAEAQRVARDPSAQYQRDKARIYAARAGAPGRAYQQGVLERQGREGALIKRELNNFKTKMDTEQAFIAKIDAEAGKAADRASKEITEAMNTKLNMNIADQESFDRLLKMDGNRLIKEAELRVSKEANISLAETRKLAAETQHMATFTAALTAANGILTSEREALEKELLTAGLTEEEKAEKRKALEDRLLIQYIGPMREIFDLLTEAAQKKGGLDGSLEATLGDIESNIFDKYKAK